MTEVGNNNILRAVVDTAKEIKSGGESVHQIVGELSISIERVVGIYKSQVGWSKEDASALLDRMLKENERILAQIYENQDETRKFIVKISVIISTTLVLITIINKFY